MLNFVRPEIKDANADPTSVILQRRLHLLDSAEAIMEAAMQQPEHVEPPIVPATGINLYVEQPAAVPDPILSATPESNEQTRLEAIKGEVSRSYDYDNTLRAA